MILKNYNSMLLLFTILIVGLITSLATMSSYKNNRNMREAFDNYKLNEASQSVNAPGRLLDSFPSSKRDVVSNDSYNDIWWYYPIFKLGSYAQVTNNLKHFKNPDEGTCIGAEFCGSLYKSKKVESNIIKPLEPVPDSPGTRVNYYRTPENLFLSRQPGTVLELPAF